MSQHYVCEINLEYLLLHDISNLVLEFLDLDEQRYVNGHWSKIQDACSFAAKHGFLDLLQWARLNGCGWDVFVCSDAAKNGHLKVLQWARSNGCNWDSRVCFNAAANGHLETLKWARSNGCEWNSPVCYNAAALDDHSETMQWITSNGRK